jgi:hypothetical protein
VKDLIHHHSDLFLVALFRFVFSAFGVVDDKRSALTASTLGHFLLVGFSVRDGEAERERAG